MGRYGPQAHVIKDQQMVDSRSLGIVEMMFRYWRKHYTKEFNSVLKEAKKLNIERLNKMPVADSMFYNMILFVDQQESLMDAKKEKDEDEKASE